MVQRFIYFPHAFLLDWLIDKELVINKVEAARFTTLE